ncbi:MAG TPA: hypothetical protein VFE01_04875, partial [Terracidiphilus sp.]|nr:hypothetical protein [Terracidiphilus sp.]
MKLRSGFGFSAGLWICAAGLLCIAWAGANGAGEAVQASTTPAPALTIDYPLNGSIFPPDITAPT